MKLHETPQSDARLLLWLVFVMVTAAILSTTAVPLIAGLFD